MPDHSTLAPKHIFGEAEKEALHQVSLLCNEIEKQARSGHELRLDDVRVWWERLDPSAKEKVVFLDYGPEILIRVFNKFLIRYFKPDAQNLLPDPLFVPPAPCLPEKIITPYFKRQVYNVTPFLPVSHSIEGIFKDILTKAHFSEGEIPVKVHALPGGEEENNAHICALVPQDDGHIELWIHPEFERDYNDIRASGIGFCQTFEDGVVRWIDLADSIAYRAAMHEIMLPRRPGRLGRGHGYRGEDGKPAIFRSGDKDHDELEANIAGDGRRYNIVNNFIWLWYRHSYNYRGPDANDVRFNDGSFKVWLNYIFYADSQYARDVQSEFPNLVNDPAKLRQAIHRACLLNREYFAERKKLGIDTRPIRDRQPASEENGSNVTTGKPAYHETGEVLKKGLIAYLESNKYQKYLTDLLSDETKPILLRVPVEILKAIGKENAADVLSVILRSPNVAVELFAGSGGHVTQSDYAEYGIEKRTFFQPKDSNRTNTITLFLTGKEEKLGFADLRMRIGNESNLKPTDTILMPVGLSNEGQDKSGLARSVIMGLRLMKIARDHKNGAPDAQFEKDTIEQFEALCDLSTSENFDLSVEDLVNIAVENNINKIMRSLKKIIRLLPITPIDPEMLRQIYLKAKEVLEAA